MTPRLVLRVVARLLVPQILLFALYVQFHGDFGPGGGFQAGVIFAAGFVLYGLVFGFSELMRVMPPLWVRGCVALGVLLYAGTGLLTTALGGAFLDYNVLSSEPISGQHLGIFVVELGVGITVFGVMLIIFYAFGDREPKL